MKGTDGDAKLYRCGKSMFGQTLLLSELHVSIDAHVKAPGHGKWWLDGKMGPDKRFIQQCMCSIITPERERVTSRCSMPSGLITAERWSL